MNYFVFIVYKSSFFIIILCLYYELLVRIIIRNLSQYSDYNIYLTHIHHWIVEEKISTSNMFRKVLARYIVMCAGYDPITRFDSFFLISSKLVRKQIWMMRRKRFMLQSSWLHVLYHLAELLIEMWYLGLRSFYHWKRTFKGFL
jgi:hypothetical protein